MSSWRLVRMALALVMMAALSCVTPRTEVKVTLTTDLDWGADASVRSLVVTVRSGAPDGPLRAQRVVAVGRAPGLFAMPASFGVVPNNGDASEVFWVEAHACSEVVGCEGVGSAARAITTQRAITGYAVEVTTSVDLFLADACRDVRCDDPRQTCASSLRHCVDARRGAMIAAPRPIAPLSTATVTSQRPTLRWALGRGTDGAAVQICADRACRTIQQSLDVAGTSAAPTTSLTAGVHYWRLIGRAGSGVFGTTASPTWEFLVGARSAPVDTSSGTTLDVNDDGYADVIVGASGGTSLTGRAYVYLGGSGGLVTSPATTLTGPDARGNFGWSVASAGDVPLACRRRSPSQSVSLLTVSTNRRS